MELSFKEGYTIDDHGSMDVVIPYQGEAELRSLVDIETGIPLADVERLAGNIDAQSENTLTAIRDGRLFVFLKIKDQSYACVKKAFQSYARKRGNGSARCGILLSHLSGANDKVVEAAVNGLVLGMYDPGLYKSDNGKKSDALTGITIFGAPDGTNEDAELGLDAAGAQLEIFRMVNAPSNKKNPASLAAWAVKSGKKYGYDVAVWDEKELEEKGFHAVLAVNRGSEFPARLIKTEYKPEDAGDAPLIAFVGKGVTFDTGGLSIKPSNNMHYMKSDMGGAAAVLGAVELIARRKLPVHVLGFVPCTDNSVDAKAIKPGDVIGSYSGQTIEVINTDAEGRLILSDALHHAVKDHKPDIIIDLATLTGSIVRALGSHCAGLFTHNDDLARNLIAAGEDVGERVWRMPLWEEYADDMKSDIADIKNLGDKPMAGSITAAKFLEHFVEAHPAWAHLDIAGTAFTGNGGSRFYSATAFGVRLLFEFVKQQIRK